VRPTSSPVPIRVQADPSITSGRTGRAGPPPVLLPVIGAVSGTFPRTDPDVAAVPLRTVWCPPGCAYWWRPGVPRRHCGQLRIRHPALATAFAVAVVARPGVLRPVASAATRPLIPRSGALARAAGLGIYAAGSPDRTHGPPFRWGECFDWTWVKIRSVAASAVYTHPCRRYGRCPTTAAHSVAAPQRRYYRLSRRDGTLGPVPDNRSPRAPPRESTRADSSTG